MKCLKCEKENKSSSKFCRYCGIKLIKDKKEHKEDEKILKNKVKISNKAGIIVIFVTVAIIFGIIWHDSTNDRDYNSGSSKCRDIQVSYQDSESYTEEEPYQDIECNDEPYSYVKGVTSCKNSLLYFGDARVECTVGNQEDKAGIFEITAKIKCKNGAFGQSTTSIPIQAYSEGTHRYKGLSECDVEQCLCEVEPPTKEVCKKVIKYKTITKYRPVTKYRTEQRCD